MVGFWIWLRGNIFQQCFEFSIPSSSHPIYLRSNSSDIEVYSKVYIEREYHLPFASSPTNILDLGANIGLAALVFSAQFPHAQIIAVEPDPKNFVLLRRNVAHLTNVTCIQAAVWPDEGSIRLNDPGLGHWAMRVTQVTDQGFDVPAISMESLLARLPAGRADLVKIDIEGAEKELFEAPHGWLDQVQSLVIELHDRYKPGCSRAFFAAVQEFPHEQWCGENIWVWRDTQASLPCSQGR
jgi:FkbM family methyltransferase